MSTQDMSEHTNRKENDSDHDLLIRIDTKLGLLFEQFHKHSSDAIKRIGLLEETKTDKEQHNDHETRLRRIEQYGAIAVGILYALQAIFQFNVF